MANWSSQLNKLQQQKQTFEILSIMAEPQSLYALFKKSDFPRILKIISDIRLRRSATNDDFPFFLYPFMASKYMTK